MAFKFHRHLSATCNFRWNQRKWLSSQNLLGTVHIWCHPDISDIPDMSPGIPLPPFASQYQHLPLVADGIKNEKNMYFSCIIYQHYQVQGIGWMRCCKLLSYYCGAVPYLGIPAGPIPRDTSWSHTSAYQLGVSMPAVHSCCSEPVCSCVHLCTAAKVVGCMQRYTWRPFIPRCNSLPRLYKVKGTCAGANYQNNVRNQANVF